MNGMPYWRTCIFKDIGTKKQDYLDLLAKEMARNGFQQAEKNEFWTRFFTELYLEENTPIFETPDGRLNIAIQTVPSNGDLKVGFMFFTKKERNRLFFISFSLGLLVSLISLYLIKYEFPHFDGFPLAMLWLIIWFSIGFSLPAFSALSIITRNRQLMQIMVKTAESMGSKQTTPFKRTWPRAQTN
jgi:hypothetical protein